MQQLLKALTILLLVTLPRTLWADINTGQQIINSCGHEITEQSSPTQIIAKLHCVGYVQGIIDGGATLFEMNPDLVYYCLPDEALTVTEQQKIVLDYLRARPDDLQQDGRSLIFGALVDAFGC